eukprot:jgi/Chlat1/2375/Chrsp17S02815
MAMVASFSGRALTPAPQLGDRLRRRSQRRSAYASAQHAAPNTGVRVCTNKTCRKQGAFQTFQYLRDLAPPDVAIDTCGCLGRCGSGPNILLEPAQLVVSHLNTPAHIARLLERQCTGAPAPVALKAVQLRTLANDAYERGRLRQAMELYTEAIALQSKPSLPALHSNRSALRLELGDKQGALVDAQACVENDPAWAKGHIRMADALEAVQDYTGAISALEKAELLDSDIGLSHTFRARLQELHSKAGSRSEKKVA